MKHLVEFVKTTVIGGLLLLFPLFGCIYVIVRIGGALTDFIKPLLSFLPQNRIVGIALADVGSVVILLLLCFSVGLLIKTSVGSALGVGMTRLLNRLPGFKLFSRIARIMFDQEDASGTPVMVHHGQTKQLGFLVEENSAEELTVYCPSAPSLLSGEILIVKAEMVTRLNVPAADVASVITTFGTGTRALFADHDGTSPSRRR